MPKLNVRAKVRAMRLLGMREWLRRAMYSNRQPFAAFERVGLHVLPVHWGTPIPDTRLLRVHLEEWYRPSELGGIDTNIPAQLALLEELGEIEPLPLRYEDVLAMEIGEGYERIDAEILWRMIRRFRPRLVLEVGAGMSTVFSSAALGGEGRVVAIEPYPRPALEALAGVELIKGRVQDLGLQFFERIGPGDLLFVDSSHVVQVGSDVPWLFLELLPRLPSGAMVHVHDIHLPYPIKDPEYVLGEHKFWNEVYLVQAFLQFNREFEILLSAGMLRHFAPEALKAAMPMFEPGRHTPSSLWLRRR